MDQDGKGLAKIGFSFGRDQSRAAYLQRQGDITGHPGSGRLLPSAGEMQTLNIASLQRTQTFLINVLAEFENGSFGGMPYGQALLSSQRGADYVITTTDKKAWLDCE